MNKTRWGAAAGVVVVAVGAGVAWQLGAFQAPKAPPAQAAKAGGAAGDKAEKGDKADKAAKADQPGGKKPEVPLEFVAQEVVQPRLAQLDSVVEFSGPLVAPQTAQLRARASGTLLSLEVAEGSRVRAGQVLGRVELADLGSRVAERAAMMESARAAYAQAERTHANNERLAQQQFISGSALDASRSALDTARAQLGAAQAALDTTRTAQRDGVLVAPINGIVSKRLALPGEKISPDQPVLTIVDLSRLELAGNVGTHEVARLQPGAAVQVNVEGVEAPVQGRIARIAPAAEPGTRSIGVTIGLDNPGERLRAGQYAMARAVLADGKERLTLPSAAVGNTAGQDHVWVIESGALARRAVMLGRRDERAGRVEVLQGVKADSQVLAARFDNLREGAKALVVAEKGAPGSAEKSAVVASAAASTPLGR